MNIKELFVESVTDNKKLIIGLYLLFIIVFAGTWLLMDPGTNASSANATASTGIGGDSSAVELFVHNEMSGIVTYLGSVFFGIFAVVSVCSNAFTLGILGNIFAKVLPNGGMMYIFYLIPHGIFEITAMILESSAGILLFLFIWKFIKAFRGSSAREAFDEAKKPLLQSLALMVIALVLLIIAAPIEAYLSVPISEFVTGLLGLG